VSLAHEKCAKSRAEVPLSFEDGITQVARHAK